MNNTVILPHRIEKDNQQNKTISMTSSIEFRCYMSEYHLLDDIYSYTIAIQLFRLLVTFLRMG